MTDALSKEFLDEISTENPGLPGNWAHDFIELGVNVRLRRAQGTEMQPAITQMADAVTAVIQAKEGDEGKARAELDVARKKLTAAFLKDCEKQQKLTADNFDPDPDKARQHAKTQAENFSLMTELKMTNRLARQLDWSKQNREASLLDGDKEFSSRFNTAAITGPLREGNALEIDTYKYIKDEQSGQVLHNAFTGLARAVTAHVQAGGSKNREHGDENRARDKLSLALANTFEQEAEKTGGDLDRNIAREHAVQRAIMADIIMTQWLAREQVLKNGNPAPLKNALTMQVK